MVNKQHTLYEDCTCGGASQAQDATQPGHKLFLGRGIRAHQETRLSISELQDL